MLFDQQDVNENDAGLWLVTTMVLKVIYRDVIIQLLLKFKFVLLDCPLALLFVQNSTFSSDKLLQPNPVFALSNKSFVTEFMKRKKYHRKLLKLPQKKIEDKREKCSSSDKSTHTQHALDHSGIFQ